MEPGGGRRLWRKGFGGRRCLGGDRLYLIKTARRFESRLCKGRSGLWHRGKRHSRPVGVRHRRMYVCSLLAGLSESNPSSLGGKVRLRVVPYCGLIIRRFAKGRELLRALLRLGRNNRGRRKSDRLGFKLPGKF